MVRRQKRGERRARSEKVARRRRAAHLAEVHPDGVVDCACEWATFYFEKRGLGCGCRKRKQGQPRGAGGKKSWRYDVFGERFGCLLDPLARRLDKALSGVWVPSRQRGYGCKDHVASARYRQRRVEREYTSGIVTGRVDPWGDFLPHAR